MAGGEGFDFAGEGVGAEIVGGGIDEIAREESGNDEPVQFGGVSALRRIERHLALGFAVAVEPVGAEAEAEGRKVRIAHITGEVVATGLKSCGGEAKHKWRTAGGGPETEEVSGDGMVFAGEREEAPALTR